MRKDSGAARPKAVARGHPPTPACMSGLQVMGLRASHLQLRCSKVVMTKSHSQASSHTVRGSPASPYSLACFSAQDTAGRSRASPVAMAGGAG